LIEELKLTLAHPAGDVAILDALWAFSFLLAQQSDFRRAAELLSLTINRAVSLSFLYRGLPAFHRLLPRLASEIGATEFESAWERGKSLEVRSVGEELLARFGGSL